MQKYLLTGFSGFVSYYFLEHLGNTAAERTAVLGIDLVSPPQFLAELQKFRNLSISFVSINMLDYAALEKAILDFAPTRILHLASFSSVSTSWQKPAECFFNNTNIFLNLIEVVKRNNLKSRILSVGSSEEYGIVKDSDLPLKETQRLNPSNPYAIARVSQEQLSQCYQTAFGIDIVLTRSFNHIGPRQKDAFVISHFAKELAKAKTDSRTTLAIKTGNTEIIRDFLDVRDVARAYLLLFEKGKAGEIYNVCGGKGFVLNEILKKLEAIAQIGLQKETDSALIRPIDNPVIIGDNSKLAAATGWRQEITIDQSLADIFAYWLEELENKA